MVALEIMLKCELVLSGFKASRASWGQRVDRCGLCSHRGFEVEMDRALDGWGQEDPGLERAHGFDLVDGLGLGPGHDVAIRSEASLVEWDQ